MTLTVTGLVFLGLLLLSMPIIFALGAAAAVGLIVGGYPLQVIASSVVSGSQSWVLLAIPSFIFAGLLMERCGMSHALVDLARAMVGWLPGGLGMSVISVAYLFSDLCGSIIAEVSALCSVLHEAHAARRLQGRGRSLADRGRRRHGNAGPARDLHDRDRGGHQRLAGRAVPRRLHSGRRRWRCACVSWC